MKTYTYGIYLGAHGGRPIEEGVVSAETPQLAAEQVVEASAHEALVGGGWTFVYVQLSALGVFSGVMQVERVISISFEARTFLVPAKS